MALIVQKYGGTSVGSTNLIKNVAKRIVATKRKGNQIVAVVSALGDTTNELVKKAFAVNHNPSDREMDALLATGEQVSSSLLAMAVHALGEKAVSFSGSQVGIVTDNSHTKAKIVDIKTDRILNELEKNNIVIVAGFQGVTADHNITTLGRGGSDVTAVALAAKLKAQSCQIYTDVAGVYRADPSVINNCAKIPVVSYEEMLEMASSGAKVLQLRSVEYARNYNVKLEVKSSFSDEEGTLVVGDDNSLERAMVTSIAHHVGEAKVTIIGVPDKPGIAAKVFGTLAKENINVDMILQNVSEQGITDISFTVEVDDLNKAKVVVEEIVNELEARGASYDTEIAKVSIIGAGMRSHPGVAAKMFSVLADKNINIDMISTSSIKVSCVIRAKEVENAIKVLYDAFGLSKDHVIEEKI